MSCTLCFVMIKTGLLSTSSTCQHFVVTVNLPAKEAQVIIQLHSKYNVKPFLTASCKPDCSSGRIYQPGKLVIS